MSRITLGMLALGLLTACPPATPVSPNGGKSPLDERPTLGPPRPYRAPAPEVYTSPQGLRVWLLERHELPMVSVCLALPVGSADDPPAQPGLAHVTASMLDEGAGDRDAVEISTAIADLGASFRAAVSADGSRMRLTVLRRYFDQGFGVLADVISRPRFEPKEWSRVAELWKNQLRKRVDSPGAVAGLVSQAVLYGPDSPYGHPTSGQLEATEQVTLADIESFYRQHWRPDRATLVVVGDVSRTALDAAISRSLGSWARSATPPPTRPTPPAPRSERPRLVLVDRPAAPQSMVVLVRPAVAAQDPAGPQLELVNTALGGSFTSRLNQNLREKRGWSYGAGSTYVLTRGVGPFVAQAAVEARYTAPAIRQMRAEIDKMRASGLTEDEYVKTRAQDLTGLIETHQTVEHLAWRLGNLAVLELPPGYDAAASHSRQQVSRAALAALASEHLDLTEASVVVVGPGEQLAAQLESLGLGAPERWGPDGRPAR